MTSTGFVYAIAGAIAAAHLCGCSPAPASDEATVALSEQKAPINPTNEVTSPTTEPVLAPASAANSSIRFMDASLSFAAGFPDAPAGDPVVAELRRDAENYLASLKTNARADFERMKKAGFEPRPWEIRLSWKYSARAGDIVSLIGQSSEYTGGAHPNQRFDTHIARSDGSKIEFGDMLVAKRSPSPAMVIAICEALKAAKIAKIKSATILDEPIVCVGPGANAKTEDAKIVLAPSNEAGKFGGVYAYYEPYAVGAYVEGPYVLSIQQAIFAEDLRPDFKMLFGGEAPPPG